MKRILSILGVIAVAAVMVYLAVTGYLARERAAKLDRALMDAEARVIQLEGELEAAKQRPVGPSPGGVATAAPAVPGATASAAGGPLVRYVAISRAGLTNLVRIEGTSTIHAWQVEGRLIGGSAELGAGFIGQGAAAAPPGVVEAKVSAFIPVRSLKSVEKDGRPYSDAMDEIMYGKLLEPAYKRITYTLTSLRLKEPPQAAAGRFECEATGTLCVAGETNTITMPVTVAAEADGKIQFAGSVKVKMTDFKISPPLPSLPGGIKIDTGDEVTLRFVWWVKRMGTT